MTQTTNTLKEHSVNSLITRFFGDLNKWPMESDKSGNFTQPQIRAICEHISLTGDCLWHAQFVVMKWKSCHCAKCSK